MSEELDPTHQTWTHNFIPKITKSLKIKTLKGEKKTNNSTTNFRGFTSLSKI